MVKVAFLGCDSTHTEFFARIIQSENQPFFGKVQIESLWGESLCQAQMKGAEFGIPRIPTSVDEALEGVDLAMVIGRFGDSHFDPALKALERRIPTFVDKPFTTSLSEAQMLVQVAQTLRTPLFSSSPLRFCREVENLKAEIRAGYRPGKIVVNAPAKCLDLYDDRRFLSCFFYGIHGIEMLLEILGDCNLEHQLQRQNGRVVCQLDGNLCSGELHLVKSKEEFYSIEVRDEGFTNIKNIVLDGSYYPALLQAIFEDFYQHKDSVPLSSSLKAIEILEEADRLFEDVQECNI